MSKFSDDKVKLAIELESTKVQQEIRNLEKATKSLRIENEKRLEKMTDLESKNKKESEAYRNLQKEYAKTRKEITANSKKIGELTKSVNVNHLTMAQLRKEAKQLQKQMDNTSKALDPQSYNELEQRMKVVQTRMRELKDEAKSFSEAAYSDNTKSFLWGTAIVETTKMGLRAFGLLKDKMTELIGTSLDLAESADGVTHAFAQLDRGDELLAGLRKATKGTVNDFELMKSVMKAKDFRIPLEDLGKLLSFAQLKAQQTGQSVDYMVDSIVTGLGRQSKMILDNLGISAAEIDEKMQETGDFAKVVANIIDTQLKDAGETYVSAADRALQRTTALQNKQLELGQALLKVKEDFANSYGEIIITLMSALKWIITHNLYNKLVWPILYQRIFPELKYGFTDEVRSQLREQLEKALDAK